MLRRVTRWYDESGTVVQVAVCVLGDDWEPLCEATETLGPFDPEQDALALADAACARLLSTEGYQAHLW